VAPGSPLLKLSLNSLGKPCWRVTQGENSEVMGTGHHHEGSEFLSEGLGEFENSKCKICGSHVLERLSFDSESHLQAQTWHVFTVAFHRAMRR
jgi:hypothetical protein